MVIRGDKIWKSKISSASSKLGQSRGDKRGFSFDPPHLLMYFVIAVVVIILVFLVIGQIGDKDLKESSSEVEVFRDQFSEDLNPNLISGRVIKSYELPEGYEELCVVDVPDVDVSDIVDERKIKNNVLRGSRRNVFLFGSEKEVSFYVEDLSLPSFPYYNCVKAIQGSVDVELDSNGREVIVKLPPNSDYCRNAQNKQLNDGTNLCKYLDDLYYQGYKEECCKDYGYCC